MAEAEPAGLTRWDEVLSDYEQSIQLSGDGEEALFFTGRGDHLTAPHVPLDQYDAFTVEAWIYAGFNGTIMGQGQTGEPQGSIWLSPNSRSVGGMVMSTYGWENHGKNFQDSITETLPLQWNHVALVYDGSRQRLFLNGKLLQQKPAPKPGPLDRRPLIIGGHESVRSKLFGSGLLRSIRISNAAMYAGDFTAEDLESEDGTILLYDFGKHSDWMTSTKVPDLSGQLLTRAAKTD